MYRDGRGGLGRDEGGERSEEEDEEEEDEVVYVEATCEAVCIMAYRVNLEGQGVPHVSSTKNTNGNQLCLSLSLYASLPEHK